VTSNVAGRGLVALAGVLTTITDPTEETPLAPAIAADPEPFFSAVELLVSLRRDGLGGVGRLARRVRTAVSESGFYLSDGRTGD
jgi:hypothetical protein